FGLDALETLIAGINPGASAEEIRDAILADIERFRDGAPQEDDVTLVVARIR
ncbi:MAG: SpoIIE family protein phosphatase, partial [Thermoanaerobaculia bacterium]